MIAYPSTDWSQLRNREIPGINVKLKPDEYNVLAQVAEINGQSVSKAAATLLSMILQYIEIREVTEPHMKVFVNIPELEAEKGAEK